MKPSLFSSLTHDLKIIFSRSLQFLFGKRSISPSLLLFPFGKKSPSSVLWLVGREKVWNLTPWIPVFSLAGRTGEKKEREKEGIRKYDDSKKASRKYWEKKLIMLNNLNPNQRRHTVRKLGKMKQISLFIPLGQIYSIGESVCGDKRRFRFFSKIEIHPSSSSSIPPSRHCRVAQQIGSPPLLHSIYSAFWILSPLYFREKLGGDDDDIPENK